MILLIDNYDSFSYNLYQLIGEITKEIKVIRNDEMTIEQIEELKPDGIVLSPGPGRPENAGIIIEVVSKLGKKIPILGVCLGHQAICAAFGIPIIYADKLMHGKQSIISVDTDTRIFRGCNKEEAVARYHSLVADKAQFHGELRVTATTKEGDIMAVQHKQYPIYGVQFHPESILTNNGKIMMENFIKGEQDDD